MGKKIRIATINCTYNEDSIGKIIADTAERLSGQCEFYQFAEYGNKGKFDNRHSFLISNRMELHLYRVIGKITGVSLGTGWISTKRLIKYLKKISPDIIHIHCPNMGAVNIYRLLDYIAKQKIPVVITNHCELFYTGSCVHSNECKKYESGCGECPQKRKGEKDKSHLQWVMLKQIYERINTLVMVAVSPWQFTRMIRSPLVVNALAKLVVNGVNCSVFYPNTDRQILEKYSVNGKKIILHTTAHFSDKPDDPKGGRFVIELARRIPEAIVVVVGNYDEIERDNLPENLVLTGYIGEQKILANWYSIVDVTLITSRRETFGMACAESLCCGTPIVGFKAGGPESVSIPEYSEFVEYGDMDRLEECVRKWMDIEVKAFDVAEKAKKLYGRETMAKAYYELYKTLNEQVRNA